MDILLTVIVVTQVLSALTIIGLVLLQHGKGADMGAAFGSGSSGSLFGASGSSNFLSKSTAVAAVIFFCATLALAYVSNKPASVDGGVMERLPVPAAPAAGSADNSIPVPGQSAAPGDAAGNEAAVPAPANGGVQSNEIPK